jgi:hypothetical protein
MRKYSQRENLPLQYLFFDSFQNYIAILTQENQYIGEIQIHISDNGLKKAILKLNLNPIGYKTLPSATGTAPRICATQEHTNSTPDRVWEKPSQSMLRILIQCIKPNLSAVANPRLDLDSG